MIIIKICFEIAAVAVVCGVLALVLLPFSHISGAAVGLVTLRQGLRQGAIVVVGAIVVTGLIAYVALGKPTYAIGFALVMWLPMLFLASSMAHLRGSPRR